MYKFYKKNVAFTLAEVLMVLGIIGVVATIALPNLGDSADQQLNVAKAKKVYAELSSSWDKYTLKHDIASTLNSAGIMNAIKTNLKVKGTGSSYKPNVAACSGDSDPNCESSSTLLADGSTFTAVRYTTDDNTRYFNIYFDVDGPQKGDNTLGSDIFCASITFRKGAIDTPSLEPFQQTDSITNASTIMTSGSSATKENGLLWILTYDNMDYNNCTVKWLTDTTCN